MGVKVHYPPPPLLWPSIMQNTFYVPYSSFYNVPNNSYMKAKSDLLINYIRSGCQQGNFTAWFFFLNGDSMAYVFDLSLLIVADIDECKVPNTCNGIYHNTIGNHYCTNCPSKTRYDTATMRCASTKEQNLVLGEFYNVVIST
jgi:hypothetical protein